MNRRNFLSAAAASDGAHASSGARQQEHFTLYDAAV
jgi:hypothetical protein